MSRKLDRLIQEEFLMADGAGRAKDYLDISDEFVRTVYGAADIALRDTVLRGGGDQAVRSFVTCLAFEAFEAQRGTRV